MFAIEFYIDKKFVGFLKGSYVNQVTLDINQAFLTSKFEEIKEKVKYIIDKTDFEEIEFEYKIVELKLCKIKEYTPKSLSFFNEEFDIKIL